MQREEEMEKSYKLSCILVHLKNLICFAYFHDFAYSVRKYETSSFKFHLLEPVGLDLGAMANGIWYMSSH